MVIHYTIHNTNPFQSPLHHFTSGDHLSLHWKPIIISIIVIIVVIIVVIVVNVCSGYPLSLPRQPRQPMVAILALR